MLLLDPTYTLSPSAPHQVKHIPLPSPPRGDVRRATRSGDAGTFYCVRIACFAANGSAPGTCSGPTAWPLRGQRPRPPPLCRMAGTIPGAPSQERRAKAQHARRRLGGPSSLTPSHPACASARSAPALRLNTLPHRRSLSRLSTRERHQPEASLSLGALPAWCRRRARLGLGSDRIEPTRTAPARRVPNACLRRKPPPPGPTGGLSSQALVHRLSRLPAARADKRDAPCGPPQTSNDALLSLPRRWRSSRTCSALAAARAKRTGTLRAVDERPQNVHW